MRKGTHVLATALALAAMGAQVAVVSPGTGEREVRAAGHGVSPSKAPPQTAVTVSDRAAWSRARTRSSWRRAYPRPGWTVKQGQRAARKRRNQQRNRRAHKC